MVEAELPEVKVCGEAGEDEGKEPEFPFYAF